MSQRDGRPSRCTCPGCEFHIKRLETMLAQFSADNDRLRTELEQRQAA